jgi:hypothetical protein
MKQSKLRRDALKQLIPVAIIAAVAAVILVAPAVAAKRDPACSITPSTVGLGQSYTVSAHGLPGGNVNLIVTVPDGATMTSAIGTSNGNWSDTYTAPVWSGETGTYTYTFVGKVTWPAGTYNQLYAVCSTDVS